MTEQFDYIKVEAYLRKPGPGYQWIDLTPDLIYNPRPTFSRGVTSPSVTSRTADVGTFKFSLDNSAANSAGTLGYYSPDHPNTISAQNITTGRGGWGPGVPVRISFAYDIWQPYYKWYGLIDPGGVKVHAGASGLRRVDVTASDFIWRAANHKLDLLQSQSSKTPAETMALVTANMPMPGGGSPPLPANSPLATNYDATLDPFPVVFDGTGADTTALGEFEKIAQSARVWITVIGDTTGGETLTLNLSATRGVPLVTAELGTLLQENGDAILLENGDLLLLDESETPTFTDTEIMPEGSEFSYGEDITNYVTIVTYPRELGSVATTVLWKMQTATLIEAGTSVTLRCPYNDPEGGNRIYGTDFVTPVSGTDYAAFANEDGTGTDYTASLSVTATFGSGEVELTLENTGANDFYTGGNSIPMQVRGRTVKFNDPARVIASDSGSMEAYGVKPISVDRKYAKTPVEAAATSSGEYLDGAADPRHGVKRLKLLVNRDTSSMCAFLWAEPTIVCNITESMTGLSGDTFRLTGYTAEIVDSQTVYWYPNFIPF